MTFDAIHVQNSDKRWRSNEEKKKKKKKNQTNKFIHNGRIPPVDTVKNDLVAVNILFNVFLLFTL